MKQKITVKDNKFRNYAKVDDHRRKMGLHQKFKGDKIKKEKSSNFSTVESQVRIL